MWAVNQIERTGKETQKPGEVCEKCVNYKFYLLPKISDPEIIMCCQFENKREHNQVVKPKSTWRHVQFNNYNYNKLET